MSPDDAITKSFFSEGQIQDSRTSPPPESVSKKRLIGSEINSDDHAFENPHYDQNHSQGQWSPIRPQSFKDYPGQNSVKENLKIFVKAAQIRGEPLDHVLLHGPPGLGKTTLARIVSYELGAPFYTTSGPALAKPGDLAGIVASLEKGSVLFIDEIHRIPIQVEEILYGAMEDFSLDFVVGHGQGAQTMKMSIEPFTLIGATTRMSMLSKPLQTRFGIQERLEFYEHQSLVEIICRSAKILNCNILEEGASEIARRSRGTPRVANRLLKRVWDFALVEQQGLIDRELTQRALTQLKIDQEGLDDMDRLFLLSLRDKFQGGPVGIENLAVTIGEDKQTLEDVFEPYLIFRGFVVRSTRGRMLTSLGRAHIEHLDALGALGQ